MSPVVLKKEGVPVPIAMSHHWAKPLASPAAGSSLGLRSQKAAAGL